MKSRSYASILFATAALALFAAPAVSQAQTAGKPAAAFTPPKTPWGAPDIQGVWSNVSLTQLERPMQYGERKAFTEEEVAKMEGTALAGVYEGNKNTDPNAGADGGKQCDGAGGRDCGYNAGWKDETTKVMRVNGEPRTSFITSTKNGRVPPRIAGSNNAAQRARDAAEAANAAGENTDSGPPAAGAGRGPGGPGGPGGGGGFAGGFGGGNDNPDGKSLGDRCIISFGGNAGPPMMPNGYYNNNIRIVQSRDSVAILVEMNHDVRTVRLNDKHRTDGVRPYFGDSIGWYEGNTLVVETTNYHPATSYRGASANLTVTEKFTRVKGDRLLYQFTVKDPTVWAEAWGGEYEFSPTGGDIYEYACHEGNYALEGMLAGARAEEAAAAATRGGATASR